MGSVICNSTTWIKSLSLHFSLIASVQLSAVVNLMNMVLL